jgi:hypothetical protein
MTENEKKSLDTLTIEMDGVDYVMQGGGGLKPGVSIPADTVDSDAMVDGAVQMEDLNDDVKKNMTHSYDPEDEGIVLGGLVGNQNG